MFRNLHWITFFKNFLILNRIPINYESEEPEIYLSMFSLSPCEPLLSTIVISYSFRDFKKPILFPWRVAKGELGTHLDVIVSVTCVPLFNELSVVSSIHISYTFRSYDFHIEYNFIKIELWIELNIIEKKNVTNLLLDFNNKNV